MLRASWLVVVLWWLPSAALGDDHPGDVFVTRVAPLLARACSPCHTSKRSGGLQLTSREALLKGGGSGPAIVPGDPEQSLLVRAIRRGGDLEMPPRDPLPADAVATLTAWVRAGAPWPAGAALEPHDSWALRPVRAVAPPRPEVPPELRNWARNDVDRFVLAGLLARALRPVGPASRRDLIRRAYLDLVGLPPAPEEVDAFERDARPDAFARVVDRLLASPAYGERWGRHWLDVARYSDVASQAFRYRDWVIAAFNRDMPYDRFVRAQIAADHLPEPERKELMAGLGFYAVAPPDQLDTVGSAFLGLTLGCARCHDHKFDPISTADYYAMKGVWSSSRADEMPLADADTVARYRKLNDVAEREQKALDDFLAAQRAQLTDVLASQAAAYVVAAYRVLGPSRLNADEAARRAGLDRETLERWTKYLGQGTWQHRLLDPWPALLKGAPDAAVERFAAGFQSALIDAIREKRRVDRENDLRTGGKKPVAANQVALVPIDRDKYYLWKDVAAQEKFLSGSRTYGPGFLCYAGDGIERFLDGMWREHVAQAKRAVAAARALVPTKYPFVHVLVDAEPKNERIRIRGSDSNLGAEVPRRFLAALAPREPAPIAKGSGRLEVADAIASRDNPLTARVMVNRIWLHHFGRGLVETPNDFGQMGARPSHPELLDYLARRFIDGGFSMKALHREIMLSATYALAIADDAQARAVDPDNRLLWRANRRRLDVEALRDSMLAVAGKLDATPGGPPMPAERAHDRRTVYGEVNRRQLDPVLALFDFPNPLVSSPNRVETITPLQGLWFLNGGEVRRLAGALAARVSREAGDDDRARVVRLYRLLYGRAPTADEAAAGVEFLRAGASDLTGYARVLLASNELIYTP